jgi:hypothetical protein
MSRSPRNLVLRLAVAAVAATALLATTSGASVTYTTELYMSPRKPVFHGRIHAPNPFCAANRRVVLFRVRRGDDAVLGVDRTASRGRWEVNVIRRLVAGRYYAWAPAYGSRRRGIHCTPDKSGMILVHPPR